MIKIKNILIFYKSSVYKNYFLDPRSSLRNKKTSLPQEHVRRLAKVHKEHYDSVKTVESCLKSYGVSYRKRSRGQKINYDRYDLVITVGGDGTFLEAAHHIKNQLILGVNSSPQTSVGTFCITDSQRFAKVFSNVLTGQLKIRSVSRLKITGAKHVNDVDVLNDVLITHKNPAAMSRYQIAIGERKEEQRSSGVWVSTPTGSSGAIHSAGGHVMPVTAKRYQYIPRELYRGFNKSYKLKGGTLPLTQSIKFVSLMREGMIFVDGARTSWAFPFGQAVRISKSKNNLRMVVTS